MLFCIWRGRSRCHRGAVILRGRNACSTRLAPSFNSARSCLQHAAFARHHVVQGILDGPILLATFAIPHHCLNIARAALAIYARVAGVRLHPVPRSARAIGVLDCCLGRERMGISTTCSILVPLTRFLGEPAVRAPGVANAAACVTVVTELVALSSAFALQTATLKAMLWTCWRGCKFS